MTFFQQCNFQLVSWHIRSHALESTTQPCRPLGYLAAAQFRRHRNLNLSKAIPTLEHEEPRGGNDSSAVSIIGGSYAPLIRRIKTPSPRLVASYSRVF